MTHRGFVWRKYLVVVILVAGLLSVGIKYLIPQQSHDLGSDPFGQAMRLHTGGTISCGRISQYNGNLFSNVCAITSFYLGRPFWVRYDYSLYGGYVSRGFVLTSRGRLVHVFYNNDPYSGSPRLDQSMCVAPRIAIIASLPQLQCQRFAP
jgi:hypothetical protein